jgi:beta-glucanase (GH16 family)
MLFQNALAALSLLSAASAIDAPIYANFTRKWQANWKGAPNTLPPASDWNIIQSSVNDNNEFQTYTNSNANLRYNGSEALQIIPRKDASAVRGWTSARIETKFTITPEPGKVTRIESALRIGGGSAKSKQGLWPAFWMMGDSFRSKGTPWPQCGELDIFENINGQASVVGVAHCDTYPNGACNEPVGLAANTPLLDNKMHVWRIEINRTASFWADQTITWFSDGKQYHKIKGSQLFDSAAWITLAQSPLYLILNVAMGGNWPGPPNADTGDSYGSMMENNYVAWYVSN